ncbi:MAG TPA: flagellar biosynthesis protein FlhB [Porticoccaceae bacterium]|jgi:flagellar biosynthetic protein FlhB|nr:flagellar biosynthesis protein FlhB [Porticoccaceae bacterium]
MAENETGQERTEQPTPKRLQEARKKGQVPRSRELNTLITLLCGAFGLLAFGSSITTGLAGTLEHYFSLHAIQVETPGQLTATFGEAMWQGLLMLIPMFLILIAGAFAGPLMLGGWTFSTSAIAFKLEKIDPLKGLKRIASLKSLMELLKAIAKFFLVTAVAVGVIWALFDELLLLGKENPQAALAHTGDIAIWAFLGFCLALIAIAGADVPFQLWDHSRQMRMTRQEIKDEVKETEGRPEVKSKIRTLQRERAQQRMFDEIPEASVVITNPSHYAVALKYDEHGSRAPVVVAKGRDLIAARIREVASEHDIALFSAPPLARAIYATTDLNQEIPARLYVAVAQVLAYIHQLNQAARPGRPKPQPPRNLPVPEDLAARVDE